MQPISQPAEFPILHQRDYPLVILEMNTTVPSQPVITPSIKEAIIFFHIHLLQQSVLTFILTIHRQTHFRDYLYTTAVRLLAIALDRLQEPEDLHWTLMLSRWPLETPIILLSSTTVRTLHRA